MGQASNDVLLSVAFVTPEYVTEKQFDGGLANYTQRVCLALLALGHHPTVIVGSDRDESLIQQGVPVERVNVQRRWLKAVDRLTYGRLTLSLHMLYQSWLLNRRLLRLHRVQPFSIVQYTQLQAVGLFRPSSIPAVARLSSYAPWWDQGYGHVRTRDGFQEHVLEMRSLKSIRDVFGPSHLVAEAFKAELGRPVKVIESPFLLDVEKLDDTPYRDLLAGKKYLLFFGRLGQLKGLVTIADILPELLKRHPDLHFIFVGKPGPDYAGAPVMEYVWNKAGPHVGRALYLGPMRHERLYPIVAGATAVVLPSRVDNLPNTCIEAMAFRRVVIGTRGTSFEQLLVDGESGFLCQRDDPASLLAVIEKVLALPPAEREAIGQRAADRIAMLRPERVVVQLVELYRSVLSRGRVPAPAAARRNAVA